jgi:hypothetical protein
MHFWQACLASERRSTVDVRRRPGYKIWRLFKFSSILLSFKTLAIYINVGKFKLEKAPNFVTRPASNVDRRTPFGREKKCGVHISVKCIVKSKRAKLNGGTSFKLNN